MIWISKYVWLTHSHAWHAVARTCVTLSHSLALCSRHPMPTFSSSLYLSLFLLTFNYDDLTCKRGSVGQSEGLLIPRSSVRFRLKPENSNSHGFEIHRPSFKGTKLLLKVIKAIIIIIRSLQSKSLHTAVFRIIKKDYNFMASPVPQTLSGVCDDKVNYI